MTANLPSQWHHIANRYCLLIKAVRLPPGVRCCETCVVLLLIALGVLFYFSYLIQLIKRARLAKVITTPYYDSSAYGVLCVSTRTARSDLPSQRASKPYVSWFIDQVNQKVSLFCSVRPLNSTNCNSPVSQSIRFSDWSVSSKAGQNMRYMIFLTHYFVGVTTTNVNYGRISLVVGGSLLWLNC